MFECDRRRRVVRKLDGDAVRLPVERVRAVVVGTDRAIRLRIVHLVPRLVRAQQER